MKTPAQYLKTCLNERISANAGYSLRAFARDLDISPQQLSNVINGRKGLSLKSAVLISEKLGLSSHERELFITATRATFSRSIESRSIAKSKLEHLSTIGGTKTHLEMDLFKVIANWYHFALVELIKISKTPAEQKTHRLAKRLGINENEVQLALTRLQRLELISKKGNIYQVNQDTVIADQGIPNEAIRTFHKQALAKVVSAIDTQNQNQRYGSTSYLPMRVKSVSRVKSLIQEFRLKLTDEVADQNQGDEIFGLCIQFFQVTKDLNEGDKA